MYRALLILIALAIAVGCAKPRPVETEAQAIDAIRAMAAEAERNGEPLDVERAREIIAPFAASAATPVPATVSPSEPHHDILIRFEDGNVGRIDPDAYRFEVKGQTQLAEWQISFNVGDIILEDESVSDDIFITLANVPLRWGCIFTQARFLANQPLEDGTIVKSDWSNVQLYGDCIEPAPEMIPIAVPEPVGGWRVLGIVLCCITIAWLYRARRRG